MDHFELKIPVTPDVQKFLIALFSDKYTLTDKDVLGKLLINIIRAQRYNREEKANSQVYSKHFKVKIPFSWYDKMGLDTYMKQKAIIDFNEIVGGWLKFAEVFGVNCMLNYQPKKQKDAIELVRDIFNLNEFDSTEEALRKANQRYRKGKERKAFPAFKLSYSSIPTPVN